MASIAELLAQADVHPVKTARVLRGLSSRELEKKAGLPRTSLSHIESGARQPDEGQKARIAMALDVDVDELFLVSQEPMAAKKRVQSNAKTTGGVC